MNTPTRRNLILDAARAQFTSRGYDGTAVGDIAKELKISKAAITYYFPAKADFLPALLDPLIAQLRAVIDNSVAGTWPDGARALMTNYLSVLLEFSDLAVWVDTDPALRVDNRPGVALRELDQRLADTIVRSSNRTGDRLRALTVIGGLWRPLHHESPDQIRDHLGEIIDAAIVSYAPLE